MKKICVITATRAEYGLLKPLIKEISNSEKLHLQLICTGTHLSPEFGFTYDEIIKDQFKVDKKIEILLSSDSDIGVSKSLGLAVISFSEAFSELKPDLIIILGDRYELLAIASTACIMRIPIAHFSGGELTEGAIDEQIRHSVTKLSYLHFTAIEEYSRRIIQMGESPTRVFTVGEIGLDNIKSLPLLTKEEFEESIKHKLLKKNYLITYHPETIEDKNKIESDFYNILKALDTLNDSLLIFTKSNSDVGGRKINKMIDDYVAMNPKKAISFLSLGQTRYLSALQYMDAVIGNSSSGIVEVPSFKIPTINIGNRQKGRIRSQSVIDVQANTIDILKALQYSNTKKFIDILNTAINPYGDGKSVQKVISILEKIDLNNLKSKKFYDIK